MYQDSHPHIPHHDRYKPKKSSYPTPFKHGIISKILQEAQGSIFAKFLHITGKVGLFDIFTKENKDKFICIHLEMYHCVPQDIFYDILVPL